MKRELGPINALYPSLCTIVGAQVDDRANFLAVAHVGIMNHGTPQYISIGLAKMHYTNQGIKANGHFSVNLPSRDQVVECDYVGLVSGKHTDKSGLFEVYYGQTGAPLIQECPVAMDCRLHQVVELGAHEIFIGEIVATYADPEVLTGDKVDIAKVRPLLFDMASVHYYDLGQPVAQCWRVGKQLKVRD